MNEDRGARYHRLRRQAVVASGAFAVAWLAGLWLTGASAALARAAASVTSGLPPLAGRAAAIAIVVLVVAGGFELVSLPLAAYRGWFLERRYGLSSETLGRWAADHVKAFALGLVLSSGAAIGIYGSMHLAGSWWWALASLLFLLAAVFLAVIGPVVLLPVFYRFKPLEHDALRERLLALSRRAGVPVLGVFEWGLGAKTTRANAALTGMGRTRRILVSDTLVSAYSEDEIEVILAHEMAHHIHRDIWTGLLLECGVVTVSLASAAVLVPEVRALGQLPLLALAAGGVSVLLTPLTNAWSRRNERRADRFALDLTRQSAAFVSAMRRLGAQNLADERPSRVAYWFFHSHPTLEERIARARAFPG
jgi:STE24 endopeptidase